MRPGIIYKLKEFRELLFAENQLWGNKAAYLADAKRKGIPVPDGFCILLKAGGSFWEDPGFRRDVKNYYEALRRRTGACYYIARSSAQCEDRKKHIYPGIFKSKQDISDFEELMEALQICCQGFQTETSFQYMENIGARRKSTDYYCVIIQEQIEPDYSGVIFTKVPLTDYFAPDSYFVEMVPGRCQEMLLGKDASNSYIIKKERGIQRHICLNCPREIYKGIEQEIFDALRKTAENLTGLYGNSLDIEWGYKDGEIFIFQIRPFYQQRVNLEKHKYETSIGLKAEAMKKFYEMGLFSKKLFVLENLHTVEEILQALNGDTEINGRMTVRYSSERNLGLPRCFARDKKEALEFIRSTWRQGWTVIVHESIDVCHSYELYMDTEKVILEHVPGMWETDNNSPADLWIFSKGEVEAYAVNIIRTAKFEDAVSEEYREVEPYGEREMKKIAFDIFPYIQKLREKWEIKNAENFHFVGDADGKIYFLNHRKSLKLDKWPEVSKEQMVIQTKEDFQYWNGEDILLKIDMTRGEEILLKEYVPFLKKTKARVYVQFGILSHPAILLREMGVNVYPEYALHKKYEFIITKEGEL